MCSYYNETSCLLWLQNVACQAIMASVWRLALKPCFLFALKGWRMSQVSKVPYLDPWQRDSSLSILH